MNDNYLRPYVLKTINFCTTLCSIYTSRDIITNLLFDVYFSVVFVLFFVELLISSILRTINYLVDPNQF